jgi:hypothetical protein
MVHWAPRFGRIFQLALCASLAPLAAHADTDACTLVTAAQVSAAVHVAVGEGTHMMATFVKTCTWTPTDSTRFIPRPRRRFSAMTSIQTAAERPSCPNTPQRPD